MGCRLAGGWLLVLVAACSPAAELPSGVTDPGATRTPAGALAVYYGALALFRDAFGAKSGYVAVAGQLSDELQNGTLVGMPVGTLDGADARVLPRPMATGDEVTVYNRLQRVRGQARQGIGLLHEFAPDASPALRGHLYAISGYSEVLLAELFCSGIPLSTLDYEGDYTLRPGSSTAEVLTHAVAQFDTAIALSADSARILALAQVGKARALLGLGDRAAAAAAAAAVPDGFAYEVHYAAGESTANFAAFEADGSWANTVADREGINGQPFISSGDPRTATTIVGVNPYGMPIAHPNKYATDGSSPVVLASWVEARLIEAEEALVSGDASWLTTLNRLRQTAIVPALPDTTDPGLDGSGTDAPRLDLLFRERAFWLFLTGHRQGDLRRLIRQYGRNTEAVYPTGAYSGGSGAYGSDVTVPVPVTEQVRNPLYSGCLARGA